MHTPIASIRIRQWFPFALLVGVAQTLAACNDHRVREPQALRAPGVSISRDVAARDLPQVDAVALKRRDSTTDAVLASPGPLLVLDTLLVVIDYQPEEKPIVLYDVRTMRMLGRLGRMGSGPGELQSPFALGADATDSARFWVLDAALLKLTPLRLSDLSERSPTPSRDISLAKAYGATAFVWTSDSTVLLTGSFQDGRYGVLSVPSGNVTWHGTLRGDPKVHAMFRNLAYETRPASLSESGTVALLAMYAGDVELTATDGAHRGFAETPFAFEPQFKMVTRGDRRGYADDSARFGYISAASSKARLFGLFSGRRRSTNDGVPYVGRYVHVFNHLGAHCGVLLLDQDAIAIAVNADGSRLFASARDGETQRINRYDIPRDHCDLVGTGAAPRGSNPGATLDTK